MHKSHQLVLQKCDVVCYGKAHAKTHTGGSTNVGSNVQACSLQDKELPNRTQALSQEALKECRCLGAPSLRSAILLFNHQMNDSDPLFEHPLRGT